jgi:hypothetical protein
MGDKPLPPPSASDESTAESRMESIYASEPTTDDKPVMESRMESVVDDNATPPKHLVNVVAMANGLCETQRTPTGKGRRSQSRTCCRNRQSRQTNRYLAHHDVHCSEHPSLSESNSTVPDGLRRAAQSRGVSRNQKARQCRPSLQSAFQ